MAATTIQSTPSLGGSATLPSNAGTVMSNTGANWGIDNTLSGWIIQSETITRTAVTDPTQDQKGALVHELDYDENWTLQLNVIGGSGGTGDGVSSETTLPEVGDTNFTYATHKWKVDAVTYQGTYNDKKKYTVSAHRAKRFPAGS